LPADLLNQKTSTGHILILNRIGWAKSYLKQGKFIEQPRRAIVKITPKGLATLKAGHLTLAELRKDADYISTQKAKQDTPNDEPIELVEKDYSPQDLIEQGFDTIKAKLFKVEK
jgi:restriction system protein